MPPLNSPPILQHTKYNSFASTDPRRKRPDLGSKYSGSVFLARWEVVIRPSDFASTVTSVREFYRGTLRDIDEFGCSVTIPLENGIMKEGFAPVQMREPLSDAGVSSPRIAEGKLRR
jgi:hypothetical protein